MPTDLHSFNPHSSTWSVLRCLSTLSPPPSWPSIDELSLGSSGDIPIILHAGIATAVSIRNFSSGSSLDISGDERDDKSVASVGTVGTFGEVRFKIRRPTVKGTHPTRVSDIELASELTCPAIIAPHTPQKDAIRASDFTDEAPHSTIVKRLSIPEFQALVKQNEAVESHSPLREKTLNRSPTRVFTLPATTVYTGEDGAQLLVLTPSHSLSTLPTPIFAPPSPSPSYSLNGTPESSPSRAFKHRLRYAVNKGISYVAARHSPSSSPSNSPVHATRSPPVSPTITHDGVTKRRGFRYRSGSTSTTESTASSPSAPPPVPTIEVMPSALSVTSLDLVRYGCLPVSLSWLKATTVELLMDQEGFRTVQPIFQLVGYSGPSGAQASISQHLASARADFMPTKRQSFVFHYAALDTPPVLRRLMINGDASHDYTSRQAYLPLKSNGPYSVQGTEAAHAEASGMLSWRLDYLVGDRKTDKGKLVPGEKTLTPLCFSCSPGLLHAAHAKKVRLMHVVRKGIVAKLTAERLEPPAPPRSYLVSRGLSYAPAKDQDVNAHAASTHRRVKSHALKRSPAEVNLGPAGRGGVMQSSTSYQEVSRTYEVGDAVVIGRSSSPQAVDRQILSSAMIASIVSEPVGRLVSVKIAH